MSCQEILKRTTAFKASLVSVWYMLVLSAMVTTPALVSAMRNLPTRNLVQSGSWLKAVKPEARNNKKKIGLFKIFKFIVLILCQDGCNHNVLNK